MRGQEIVLAQFCIDSLLHMVGEEIGVDPVELRAINAVPNNWHCANGIVVDVSGLSECIAQSSEKIGWKESRKSRPEGRGIGFSCASHPSGPRLGGHFGSSVMMKLLEDGQVIVTHGATEIGQGANTVFCQMAAEESGPALRGHPSGSERLGHDDLRLGHVRRPRDLLGRQRYDSCGQRLEETACGHMRALP